MATGYNTKSISELKKDYISYKSIDFDRGDKTRFLKMSNIEIVDFITSDCFVIESQNKPFDEEEDLVNNF